MTIKRQRRTKAAMGDLAEQIEAILAEEPSQTVRQVFYRLVSAGAIDKTELQYRACVRILTDLRGNGRVGFDQIADNTRWVHKPASFHDVTEALQRMAVGYRRDPWQDQPNQVEVWLEKDALAGVIYDVTAPFDVPLMVARGFPSITFLHNSAREIPRKDKPAVLLYLGDYDPSGEDITRAVDDGIRSYAPETEIELEKVAVTEAQIRSLKLPTRPTKGKDPRAAAWDGDGSVEVDAIAPRMLRDLVRKSIERHIDRPAWDQSNARERQERSLLTRFLSSSRIGREFKDLDP